jgi:phosphohistidine phosphatase
MAPRRHPLVLLVRHGKAEDDHPLGDGARALTDDGRDDFRAHARRVAAEVKLEGIATSPLVRAVQTAEILAEACGLSRVAVHGELDFTRASPTALESLCRSLGPGWALVGHNPSMAETLAHLLGRAGEPPRFRKGAVAALRLPASGAVPWELAWMWAPGKKATDQPE